jgi:hypothetical protein
MLAVIVAFVMTTIIYPAWELYASNVGEFSFKLAEVGIYFVIYTVGIIVVIWLFGRIWGGKFRKILTLTLWIMTICAYIQGMFLNGKLFLMDGKDSDWGNGTIVSNLIVWIALIALCIVIAVRLDCYIKQIVIYSSLALIVMQLAGAGSLIVGYVNSEEEKEYTSNDYLSTEGLCEVADKDNIIIFVLDTYDVDYLNQVLEKYPDFLSPLKGFTYYPDYVSQFSRTYPSITYMLTGEEYFYEIPQEEYYEEAFTTTGSYFWNGLKKKGFSYYLYEAESDIIGKSTRQKALNYIDEGHQIEAEISFVGFIKSLNNIAGYRNLPYVLKNYNKYTAEMINDWTVNERILDSTKFEDNDSKVYEYLKNNPLSVSDKDSKSLRFIHLNGAHAPYSMDENGNAIPNQDGTAIGQYIGSMRLVYDYIQMLQDIDMYENSTVIITADHGENYVTSELNQNTNPILFIKPRGGGCEDELVISDVYASQIDLLPTICAIYGIKCDVSDGLNLFDTKGEDKTRVRYHNYTVVENMIQVATLKYEIIGSSLDFNNWHSTGEYHKFGEYY